MAYLEELLPEFRKGAKIRQNDWDEDVFIYFDKDEIYWKDGGAWKDGKIASTKDLVSIFTLHHNDWEFYKEPIDWYKVIRNKCPCWFWDDDITFKVIGTLQKINEDSSYKRRCGGDWTNCRPIHKEEITFYKEGEIKND